MEELRLRRFESNKDFNFLPENDRFLFKKKSPLLNIGIIGTGTIGLEHIRVAGLEERARVAGLFDLNLEVLTYAQKYTQETLGYTPKTYQSLHQMANDSQLHGFLICTPNYQHLQNFQALYNTAKPVYIEKPMAHTLAHANELYQLALNYKAPVHIGLQYRFKPHYAELLKELQSPLMANPTHIQIIEHRPPFLDKVNQWNKYNETSGGTLIEKCCHYFNLMQLVAKANPIRINCQAQQAHNFTNFSQIKPSDIIDSAHVMIEFSNGIFAALSLCMFAPSFYEEITVCLPNIKLKATEEFNPILQQDTQCFFEVLQGETLCSKKYQPSYGQAISLSGHSGSTFKAHELFIDHMLEFYKLTPQSKRARSSTPNCVNATLKESLWSILMGHAAQVAAQEGTVIAVEDIIRKYDIKDLL